MSGPARGYSWPPFEQGNVAALRHGAFSERAIEPLAAHILSDLLAHAPNLDVERFAYALRAWSRVEAQAELVSRYLAEHGPLDDKGRPRPAATLLLQFERAASNLRASLGLDPSSFARLLRDLAATARDRVDASEELAEGRRLRVLAESRMTVESAWETEP